MFIREPTPGRILRNSPCRPLQYEAHQHTCHTDAQKGDNAGHADMKGFPRRKADIGPNHGGKRDAVQNKADIEQHKAG